MREKEIIGQRELHVILNRLCCQLIENHNDFSNSVFIGLQPQRCGANQASGVIPEK
jgi:pyrimidine operon attenuation protein/uracil phosphoribosyltransferase